MVDHCKSMLIYSKYVIQTTPIDIVYVRLEPGPMKRNRFDYIKFANGPALRVTAVPDKM